MITNILLSYLFSYILIKILLKKFNKTVITSVVVVFAILIGIVYQLNILSYSNRYPYFSQLYTSNKIANGKIYIKLSKWNPEFKIKNNSELFNYLDSYNNITTVDYTPKNDLSNFSYVNKNIVQSIYGNKNIGKMHRNGYNHFSFNVKEKTSDILLPIYSYKNEKMIIYIDGKESKYQTFNGRLRIDKVPKGNHKLFIYIPHRFNNFINVFFIFIGWVSVIIVYKKKEEF